MRMRLLQRLIFQIACVNVFDIADEAHVGLTLVSRESGRRA